ncbi:hypothetical protein ACKWTF_002158 [Chironomus riparius]
MWEQGIKLKSSANFKLLFDTGIFTSTSWSLSKTNHLLQVLHRHVCKESFLNSSFMTTKRIAQPSCTKFFST